MSDVDRIRWIVENSNATEKEAIKFVQREYEQHGNSCWSWEAIYIVDGQPAACHLYDANDWRKRGHVVCAG